MNWKANESLAKHTTFHIGGTADWYVEAKTVQELQEALAEARRRGIPVAILGGGSNSLFADAGFRGLVVRPMLTKLEMLDNGTVRAEAGVLSSVLARKTAERGLAGFEWAITLPGTIGGAVRGNAGCFGGETKDRLQHVEVLKDGEVIIMPESALGYGYRDSSFKHHPDWVVLAASFKLEPGSREACLARTDEIIAKRKATQPSGTSSAGCMFKNPMVNGKLVPAGKLIDDAGLKGFCVGGACVSDVHGNFLVVKPGTTADHVVQLVSVLKTRVRNQFGIQLEEEVQFWM